MSDTLYINNVTKKHEGFYFCVASNAAGRTTSNKGYFHVLGKFSCFYVLSMIFHVFAYNFKDFVECFIFIDNDCYVVHFKFCKKSLYY